MTLAPPAGRHSAAELAARLLRRQATDPVGRVLVGVVGEPGGGKSTLSAAVADELWRAGVAGVVVPMDGFHLANAELERLGRREHKGAIDTFDGWGLLNLVRRLRARDEDVVMAPAYVRGLEEAVAGAIAVPRTAEVVVIEGNYLLDDSPPWAQVGGLLDESWFVELDRETRRSRLVARHVRFGMTPEGARRWVELVDEPNAARIRAVRARADLAVRVAD